MTEDRAEAVPPASSSPGAHVEALPAARVSPASTPTAGTPARLAPASATIAFPSFDQITARDFHVLTKAELARLAQLEKVFWTVTDADRRTQILDEIDESLYGDETLAFLAKVLELNDEALALRVIEILTGNTSADILPVLEKALASRSDEVRASAALAVGQVRDDAVVPFLGKVFDDAKANVRLAGLEVLETQTEERKLKILGRALEAPHADVQTGAIDHLQLESTPQSVEVLFAGLDSADPEVRREAQFSIDFLLNEEFKSAAEARAWWQANRSKFDKDLTLKE